jgi:hypothetical protein
VDLKRKPFDLLLELPLGRSKRRTCKTHQLPLDSAPSTPTSAQALAFQQGNAAAALAKASAWLTAGIAWRTPSNTTPAPLFSTIVDFPVSIYDFERNLTEAKASYDGLRPSADSILAAKNYNDRRDGA